MAVFAKPTQPVPPAPPLSQPPKKSSSTIVLTVAIVVVLIGLVALEGWNRVRESRDNAVAAGAASAKARAHHSAVISTPATAIPNATHDHTAADPKSPPKNDGVLINE